MLPQQFVETIKLSIHLDDDHLRKLCGMRGLVVGEIRGNIRTPLIDSRKACKTWLVIRLCLHSTPARVLVRAGPGNAPDWH